MIFFMTYYVFLQGGKGGQINSGEDEPLHALVTGPTNESVQKAVAMVGLFHLILN